MDECWFCRARKMIGDFMKNLDGLPEIHADLYDDAITDLFNQCEDTYYLLCCYCDDEIIPPHPTRAPGRK